MKVIGGMDNTYFHYIPLHDHNVNTTPFKARVPRKTTMSENLGMTSPEKEFLPLGNIPPKHESIADQPSTSNSTDLVFPPANRFPSRPWRRVAVIAVVVALVFVIIVAAALIGIYIPEYLRNANSRCKYTNE